LSLAFGEYSGKTLEDEAQERMRVLDARLPLHPHCIAEQV
jgi:hypothetical protein